MRPDHRWPTASCSLLSIVLLIIPSILFALFATSAHCLDGFALLCMITPRSISSSEALKVTLPKSYLNFLLLFPMCTCNRTFCRRWRVGLSASPWLTCCARVQPEIALAEYRVFSNIRNYLYLCLQYLTKRIGDFAFVDAVEISRFRLRSIVVDGLGSGLWAGSGGAQYSDLHNTEWLNNTVATAYDMTMRRLISGIGLNYLVIRMLLMFIIVFLLQ